MTTPVPPPAERVGPAYKSAPRIQKYPNVGEKGPDRALWDARSAFVCATRCYVRTPDQKVLAPFDLNQAFEDGLSMKIAISTGATIPMAPVKPKLLAMMETMASIT
jgi:hypothetical protein